MCPAQRSAIGSSSICVPEAGMSTLEQRCIGREAEGRKQLVVACGDVLMRFDLHSPSEPRLIDKRTFEGLRGVGSTGRRLLAFGEFGIVDVTAQKAFALDHAPIVIVSASA